MSRPARGTFRQTISIHALREEGDLADLPDEQREYIISIHALREEGDLSASGRGTVPRKFLSTPSARRATATVKDLALELVISIHALREEGDAPFPGPGCSRSSNFYPRPPRGGRRHCGRRTCLLWWNFYPRPPQGGRRSLDGLTVTGV